ncbi:MAG: FG-GAP-like repeat-containing protein [candidate division Zixibacteria bacterium]
MRKTLTLIAIFALMVAVARGQVVFEDMADELNINDLDNGRTAAVVDLDNDFVNEIILINLHQDNRIYTWQDSVYIEMSDYYDINYCLLANNITVADVNLDNRPDLYINDAPDQHQARMYVNDMPGPFLDRTQLYGLGYTQSAGSAFFQMTPNSGLCLLTGNRLMNMQYGTFIEITQGSGLEGLTNVFCPVFLDIDGDYDDDLFIAGDHEMNYGSLFLNNGDGTFSDISTNTDESGFGYGQQVSFGDIDNDGDFDLYVTSGFGTNKLWQNDGTGYFTNITDISNTGYGGYSRSSSFGDFDNDGDVDLYVNRTDDYKVLFINDGNGIFTDYSEEAGINDYGTGMGCAVGDLNGDGGLDIVSMNANSQGNQIYINQSAEETFLKVKVIGRGSNTLALGAILELYADSDPQLEEEFIGKREISSHPVVGGVNDLVAHFGTGDHSNLRLVIHFQSGAVTDTMGLQTSTTVIIYEPEMVAVDDPEISLPVNNMILRSYPNPFNNSTRITIHGGESDLYDLAIFDLLGRRIRSVSIENRDSELTSFTWDGQNDSGQPVPSGVYFVRGRSGTLSAENKISLLR